MKKFSFPFSLILLFVFLLQLKPAFAQVPEKMSYQSVIRGADNKLVVSHTIGIRISVLEGSPNGASVYVETHQTATNENGLISIVIGDGYVEQGDFSNIDWSTGTYFIKTETDPTGQNQYTITGTSQLLTVPYALHAKTADALTTPETDPVYSGSEAANINSNDLTNIKNLSGINSGDQDVSGIATNAANITTLQGEQSAQNAAIVLNTAKIGITTAQSNAIIANTGKDTTGIYHANRAALDLVSGTNTGDQDVSGIATNAADISTLQGEQSTQDGAIVLNTAKTGITTAQSNAIIANTAKDTTGIYHANRAALDLVSGTNTGDQDISGIATNTNDIATNAADITTLQGEQSTQDAAIVLNTAKTGITTAQSNAIIANTGKDTTRIFHANRAALDLVSGTNTGDQDISGIATNTNDIASNATAIALNTGKDTTGIYHANRTALDLVSGTNTGDQDISGITTNANDIATNSWAIASNSTKVGITTAQANAIVDNTGKDTTGIYHANRTALDLVNGTNTGDQDISGITTNADDIATNTTAIALNTAKVGITTAQANAIIANTGKDTTEIYHANRAALNLVSGTNTGDQNISGITTNANDIATNTTAIALNTAKVGITTAQANAIVANTGKDTTGIYHANRAALDLVSGNNSGDQDISGIITNANDIATNVTTIALNTAKVGITTAQSNAIIDNTGKDTTGIYHANRAALDLVSGTNSGDQDVSGIATNAADITTLQGEQGTQNAAIVLNTAKTSITTAQSAAIIANTGKDTTGIYHANRVALDLVSGTNTGDQDISGIATNTNDIATNATAIALNTAKDTTGIYHANRAALDLVSGTNTGDQDLSALATTLSVTNSLSTKVDKVTGKALSTNDYTTAEKTKLASLSSTSVNFSGSLMGDVTGTQSATVVSFVGGQTAANVAAATVMTSNATSSNTVNTLVKRNAQEDFSTNRITINGAITNATDAATKAYVDALEARIETLEESPLLNNGFTDSRDHNHYNVVKIGNQIWMAENLKYLPSVVDANTGSETDSYYYVYGYSGSDVNAAKATSNYETYGVLYNWPAAMNQQGSSASNPSGVKGVCPTGWHLPSEAEWTELTDYLGGESVAGGKLKEIGTAHWYSPNTGATNETYFTALPGGYRDDYSKTFFYIELLGSWWSASEKTSRSVLRHYMLWDTSTVIIYNDSKESGFSVRCVRD